MNDDLPRTIRTMAKIATYGALCVSGPIWGGFGFDMIRDVVDRPAMPGPLIGHYNRDTLAGLGEWHTVPHIVEGVDT